HSSFSLHVGTRPCYLPPTSSSQLPNPTRSPLAPRHRHLLAGDGPAAPFAGELGLARRSRARLRQIRS
uniref:Uncharacterized protein n=1 Tax=Aegilops tauschii subsp. strangulata TaxID=200361 RepID=A0A452YGD2_AEGTS